jgi:hypothetical protein
VSSKNLSRNISPSSSKSLKGHPQGGVRNADRRPTGRFLTPVVCGDLAFARAPIFLDADKPRSTHRLGDPKFLHGVAIDLVRIPLLCRTFQTVSPRARPPQWLTNAQRVQVVPWRAMTLRLAAVTYFVSGFRTFCAARSLGDRGHAYSGAPASSRPPKYASGACALGRPAFLKRLWVPSSGFSRCVPASSCHSLNKKPP